MISSQPGNASYISGNSNEETCRRNSIGEQSSSKINSRRSRADRGKCGDKSSQVAREGALTDVVFRMKVRMHLESLWTTQSYRLPSLPRVTCVNTAVNGASSNLKCSSVVKCVNQS